ncbi:leucine-zipper-like transcriptional regulator 1 [Pelomyxa schiedti]|nr:leucine-zipper-like transcriptional regulator 1 [Pelomyxa schiedti]
MRATLGRLLLRDESSSRSLRMQWAPVTCKSTLPLARYGHTMTLGEDGKIYVLCGHLDNVGGAFLKEFFVCDPATLMWERLPDTPFCSRNLHCCVAYGGALWVSFGRGNGYLGDLHCFVLATKEWKVIEAKGKRLLRRYGSTAVVWNGNMWVFGGYDENGFSSNDLNCFSFDTLTWSSVEQLGAIPEARHNHMSDIVIVNENPYLLIFGGRGAYSPLADANLFSFQSHLWTSVPPSSSPSPRFACSGAFVPAFNCALIYGGTDGKTDFSDAYILDLGSLHWHKGRKGDSPPVSFHSSVVVGNEVWFYGGKGVAPAILSCKIIDATNSSPLPGKHSPSSRIRHIRASIHHSCSGTSGVSGSAASSSSSTTTSDARSVTSHQTEGAHTPYDIEYTPTKPPSVSTPRVEIITTSTVSAAPASPTVTEDANNSDIKKWLCTLGLETYAEVFIAEEISLSTLPSLTEDDLKVAHSSLKRVLAEAKLLKSTPPVILSTTTESEMHLKDVVPTAILGQGAHGAVYSGVWQGTTPVALKMIKSNTEREFMQEFSVLKGLRHPNLIQFLGVFTPDTPLIFGSDVLSSPFIVTELAQLGSLDHYLETTSLTMSTILEFGKMIAAGMNYLSQRQIVHRYTDLPAFN